MYQLPYVVVALFAICLALCIIFYMAYTAFGRPPHAKTWSISFGAATLQWALNVAYMYVWLDNIYLYWPLANILGASVPAFGIAGYCQRSGKRVNIPLLVGIVTTVVLSIAWFTFIDWHVGFQTSILPFYTAGMSFWAAWIVFDIPRKKRIVEWGLINAYSILAAVEILLGILGLNQGADGETVYATYYSKYTILDVAPSFCRAGNVRAGAYCIRPRARSL